MALAKRLIPSDEDNVIALMKFNTSHTTAMNNFWAISDAGTLAILPLAI